MQSLFWYGVFEGGHEAKAGEGTGESIRFRGYFGEDKRPWKDWLCGNSPYTVKGESMSAGRLYDKIGEKAKARVVFLLRDGALCKVTCCGSQNEESV